MRIPVFLLVASLAAALAPPAAAGGSGEEHAARTSCYSIVNPISGTGGACRERIHLMNGPTASDPHLWIEVNYVATGFRGFLLEFLNASTGLPTLTFDHLQFAEREDDQALPEGGVNLNRTQLPAGTYDVRLAVNATAGEFEFVTEYNEGPGASSWSPPCETVMERTPSWAPWMLRECAYGDPWGV